MIKHQVDSAKKTLSVLLGKAGSNWEKAAATNPSLRAMSDPEFSQTPVGQEAIMKMAIASTTGGDMKTFNTALGGGINTNAKFQAALNQNKGNLLKEFGGTGSRVEAFTGWKPGVKQAFDFALLNRDGTTVKRMLDHVPADYKIKMFRQIADVLKNTAQLII